MWAEATRWFGVHKGALRGAGIDLRARLEPDSGLMNTYANGVIRLALPDASSSGGALRAALLGAVLGLAPDRVERLFRALLPRLVAHEIGHALRAEAGTLGDDPWVEEQAADRLAHLLSRPHLAGTRPELLSTLRDFVPPLGGLAEALSTHRHERALREMPELAELERVPSPPGEASRDLTTFARISAAWTYFDLLLDPEDDLDAYRRDLLLAR